MKRLRELPPELLVVGALMIAWGLHGLGQSLTQLANLSAQDPQITSNAAVLSAFAPLLPIVLGLGLLQLSTICRLAAIVVFGLYCLRLLAYTVMAPDLIQSRFVQNPILFIAMVLLSLVFCLFYIWAIHVLCRKDICDVFDRAEMQRLGFDELEAPTGDTPIPKES